MDAHTAGSARRCVREAPEIAPASSVGISDVSGRTFDNRRPFAPSRAGLLVAASVLATICAAGLSLVHVEREGVPGRVQLGLWAFCVTPARFRATFGPTDDLCAPVPSAHCLECNRWFVVQALFLAQALAAWGASALALRGVCCERHTTQAAFRRSRTWLVALVFLAGSLGLAALCTACTSSFASSETRTDSQPRSPPPLSSFFCLLLPSAAVLQDHVVIVLLLIRDAAIGTGAICAFVSAMASFGLAMVFAAPLLPPVVDVRPDACQHTTGGDLAEPLLVVVDGDSALSAALSGSWKSTSRLAGKPINDLARPAEAKNSG